MKCDELKAMSAVDAYEEYENNILDESRSYDVYNKQDVDEAIAELKAEIENLKNAHDAEIGDLEDTYNKQDVTEKEAAIEIVKEFKMNWYELKPMTILNAYQVECDDNDLVYSKSDVDEVIENLRSSYKTVMTDLAMENYKLKEQLRKYKIKRAEWVAIGCCRKFSASFNVEEETFWMKWLKRWIDIEDKLKENE